MDLQCRYFCMDGAERLFCWVRWRVVADNLLAGWHQCNRLSPRTTILQYQYHNTTIPQYQYHITTSVKGRYHARWYDMHAYVPLCDFLTICNAFRTAQLKISLRSKWNCCSHSWRIPLSLSQLKNVWEICTTVPEVNNSRTVEKSWQALSWASVCTRYWVHTSDRY